MAPIALPPTPAPLQLDVAAATEAAAAVLRSLELRRGDEGAPSEAAGAEKS